MSHCSCINDLGVKGLKLPGHLGVLDRIWITRILAGVVSHRQLAGMDGLRQYRISDVSDRSLRQVISLGL
jgi:hypothetical protein